jgi:hypothetical protein
MRYEWTGRADHLLATLQESWNRPLVGRYFISQVKRCAPVKKLLLLVLVGAGIFAVWRKVQADRAELDLWTEATTDDN